jgi:hypothetical protein
MISAGAGGPPTGLRIGRPEAVAPVTFVVEVETACGNRLPVRSWQSMGRAVVAMPLVVTKLLIGKLMTAGIGQQPEIIGSTLWL